MDASWRELTLDDVCSKITDGAHHSPKSVENGKPMSSVKDMTPFGLNLKSSRIISEDDFNKLVKQGCKPEVNDILISKDGNSALDTVCRVKEPVDAVLLSSVAILRPDISVIEPEFLRLYLDAEPTRQYLKATSISGAAIPRVILKDFKRAKIKLPLSLDKQRVLSSYITNYDNLVENNNRRIAILEDMAQSLYHEWFVNFRYPGHADTLDASSSNALIESKGKSKLIDSSLGQIPEGWEVKKFSELVNYKTGKLNSNAAVVGGDYPFFTCSRETFRTNTWSFDCECVLLAGNNANAIYPIKYFNDKFDAYQRTYVITEKNRDEITPSFLFYCLALKLGQLKSMSTGTSTRFLTKGILDNLDLLVPSSTLMSEFDSIAVNLLNSQASLRKRNENLKQQRDMLLPKLISGQIEL
ncbi:restriction endonuclease subunit S [Colwellia sp. 6M3]|uniref:restriction endonuclease subunit S n=1 Tax=Colwellia sp. 6M3 TaxID=2759849 RepID=UPI0015F75208|nr:restriction endonuclease subunit S [Colwellia sp. 6M3]MBA6417042.1 restriction endonuclease subunit S [Colwellia sp. 6M3]